MAAPARHTRVLKPGELAGELLATRIALFALVTRHPRALAVLEGLSAPGAAAAKKLFETVASWPSAQRQGRVALEFGQKGDAPDRLKRLVGESHPALRLALCAQMTPAQQARFSHLINRAFRQVPGRNALAARLVHEATR